jgi:CRISPR-associated protein Csd1
MAPHQMDLVSFKYAILIDEEGNYKGIEALGDDEGITLLTFRPEERTSAPVAHCLGDNGSYVLGLKSVKVGEPFDIAAELNKNKKNHAAFIKDIDNLYSNLPTNKYVKAIHHFYLKYSVGIIEKMSENVNWNGLCKSLNKNITFRIVGYSILAASDEEVLQYKIKSAVNNNMPLVCLVTGQRLKPISTTYSTFVVGGKSNAKLVSFQVCSGYDSYGKKMGLNAPISEEAEFKYTTALLSLLSKQSRNKFMIGTRTFLFWASKNDEASNKAEESIFNMFGFQESDDDPNRGVEEVRRVFTAIHSGSLRTSLEDKFYILGLAPNAARIAVSYWAEIPLKDFAELILRHFNDMEIIETRKERKTYLSLRSIISAVTLGGKASDATPNLPDAVIKSILQGTPYPYTLFAGCIRRIRAEQTIGITRAAIIKAYLNRLNDNQLNIKVMLDKENKNQGYLCGRLFAVLDKIQDDANNQHSIRERYMNAASATPSTVFATILNLSSHHSEKLNEGSKVFYEKLKQEIIDKISAEGFPAHLDLQDQGRFFVGFYHQMQDFFTKKETKTNE